MNRSRTTTKDNRFKYFRITEGIPECLELLMKHTLDC